MVPCVCIDDKNNPGIPKEKWIKEGDKYHITFTVTVLPQKVLSVSLYEKPLDKKTCYPYEYFLASRFAVKPEDLEKLIELIKDCTDADKIDINELLENSKLITK